MVRAPRFPCIVIDDSITRLSDDRFLSTFFRISFASGAVKPVNVRMINIKVINAFIVFIFISEIKKLLVSKLTLSGLKTLTGCCFSLTCQRLKNLTASIRFMPPTL
jgi:hypothetical protein